MTVNDITNLYKFWMIMMECSTKPVPTVDLSINDFQRNKNPRVTVSMAYHGVTVDLDLPNLRYLSGKRGWEIFDSMYQRLMEKVDKAIRNNWVPPFDLTSDVSLPTPYEKYAREPQHVNCKCVGSGLEIRGENGELLLEMYSKKPDVKFTKVIVFYRRKDERIVTRVFWEDDTVTEVVCQKEDRAHLYTGVAISQMLKRHGSNSAYKRHLKKYFEDDGNGVYEKIAIYETAQIYGDLNSFENRVDDVIVWGRGFENVKV